MARPDEDQELDLAQLSNLLGVSQSRADLQQRLRRD